MKQISTLLFLFASSIASACNWTNVNVGYGDSCNRYNFEVSGTVDTCFKIEAKIYLGTTLKATYVNRNFKHYFQDTGMYVLKVKIINTCTNCDTVIYKPIRVTCLLSKGCNWSKVGINYSQNCNKFTFEMGSFDTCFRYTTLAIRNGHVDTISDNRVFTHTFSDTGNYYIRTTFRNKCTKCDTVMYKEIRITCLTAGIQSWNDMAHPVSVYPNPAASSVTIGVENIHQLGEVNLVLYSPLGNVIYEQKVHADTNEIPISHLSNGIYLVHLTSDKHVYTSKIQIQH